MHTHIINKQSFYSFIFMDELEMARYQFLCLLLICCHMVTSSNIGSTREDIIHNSDGGYSNILIAIDENVGEDRQLLTDIQVLQCYIFSKNCQK